MRILLAVLLCYILVQAECSALHVGDGRGGIPVDVVGTYAGVMLPITVDADGAEVAIDPFDEDFAATNALVVFSLSVPQTGLASGALLIFSEGRVFTGTINAFADPDRGRILGVLDARFDFSVITPVTTTTGNPPVTTTTLSTVDVTATAIGELRVEVVTPFISRAVVVNPGLARLIGRGNLDISQGELDADLNPVITDSLEFVVDGVKQSNTPTDPATFTTTAAET